jgi:O-antigen/teichoic acid export membrane protein
MSSAFFLSAIGFLFWVVAARLYTKEDLGIATALISSASVIILISRLGLDQSIIRFSKEMGKKVITTFIIVSTLVALIIGIIYIYSLRFISPELAIIYDYKLLFLIFLTANSFVNSIGISFIAFRLSKYYFVQSLLEGSRILFLFPLTIFGTIGLFTSFGIGYIISLAFSAIFLLRMGVTQIGIDQRFLKCSMNFSLGNYLANLLILSPNQLLTIMVLQVLGPEEAAQYYMAYAITLLLFVIPGAFSTSLFVEGSNGYEIRNGIIKSIIGTFSLLVPAILFICIFGKFILEFMGLESAGGYELLVLLSISSIFSSLIHIYISVRKLLFDINSLIILGILIFVLQIITSYIFMIKWGLIGIGYAFNITYFLIVLYLYALYRRECKNVVEEVIGLFRNSNKIKFMQKPNSKFY